MTHRQGLGVEVQSEDGYHRRNFMSADLDAKVIAAWKESRVTTPLSAKPRAAWRYPHKAPDYNGH
jgi:hypothetical protein